MKTLLRIVLGMLGLLVLIYGVGFFTSWRAALPGYHRVFYTPERYRSVCAAQQQALARVASSGDRDSAAVLLLHGVSTELFPYWEGTRWDFNGTTETPGRGSIACGYFVTTMLRDLGVPVQRTNYARMASEPMIKKLVQEKNIQRYSRVETDAFLRSVKKKGDQLYVLGLDNHVGFLVCEKGKTVFIHSSGRWPWTVVKEDAASSVVLGKSKYRVTGCLTCDEKFLDGWLQQTALAAAPPSKSSERRKAR